MLWHPIRPSVATVHDLGVLVCPEDKYLFDRLGRAILDLQYAGLRRIDFYAVNSQSTRRALVEILGIPEERIRLVQLGVDSEHFRPIPSAPTLVSERYGIKPSADMVTLLYVGSELPRKNVGLLLKAMAVLTERGCRLRLIKVGGAGGQIWRNRFIWDIKQLGLTDDVIIVENVPEADLPLFYNVADVCVTPTLLEGGFAWLAMEAMACNRPVIATEAALIPADAAGAVLVIPTRDLDALVAALTKCVNNPDERVAMGAAGRQIVATYNWGATARAMMEVYSMAAGLQL